MAEIQFNCGAQEEHRRLLNDDPAYAARRAEIETQAWAYRIGARSPARTGITRIPLVVHVVWNTPAQNISDAQIQSQIDVLNRDFRKTNPDVANVPAVWQNVAADARIEFFLASTDPNGNATTGITRTRTPTTSFDKAGNPIKSAATGGADPWPANRYLNVWVGPRLTSGASLLLGYAQFPGGPANTDGVVILHSAFGTTGTAATPFHLGRVAAHEIGHWLNLFHIWGDDGTGCNGTDEVDDTANAAGPNRGCPTFPSVTCNNGPNGDMFMNYMDYTDDACKSMFTAGQVTRMQATLDGPRASIGTVAWNGPQDLLTVPGAVSLGGHFSTGDQRHLLVAGTAQGKVHEIWWKPAQPGIEGHDDLPVSFGADSIVSVATMYNSDQHRHVVLVGKKDGKVHEIFWKPETIGIEGHDDLPVAFSPNSIVAVSGLYNPHHQRYVVFVGTTAGKVHEIWWKEDTAGVEGHDDLPVMFAPGSIVGVTGFYNTDQQRYVVVVATSAGKLHEIFWKEGTPGVEGHDDLPVNFDSASIVAVSGFYDASRQRHVVVVGTKDGKVNQVYWQATTVGVEANSTVTQFSAGSIVGLAGWYSASDQTEVIEVSLTNGLIKELWTRGNL